MWLPVVLARIFPSYARMAQLMTSKRHDDWVVGSNLEALFDFFLTRSPTRESDQVLRTPNPTQ